MWSVEKQPVNHTNPALERAVWSKRLKLERNLWNEHHAVLKETLN